MSNLYSYVNTYIGGWYEFVLPPKKTFALEIRKYGKWWALKHPRKATTAEQIDATETIIIQSWENLPIQYETLKQNVLAIVAEEFVEQHSDLAASAQKK